MIKYKNGDVVRTFTSDRSVSWRGVVKFIGPSIFPKLAGNPYLQEDQYWILWDNGSQSTIDSTKIELDRSYLRQQKLKDILNENS